MQRSPASLVRRVLHYLGVVLGAGGFALAFFLVLPLIQAIAEAKEPDTMIRDFDSAALPPPEDLIVDEEIEEEPEEEEPPPELQEDVQPMTLEQLELALEPGVSGGWLDQGLSLDLSNIAARGSSVDALFSLADLDQKPRAIYKTQPSLNAKLRKKGYGKVIVVFTVNEKGRVEDPRALTSTDPIFEAPALAAIKKWKFEPGKRQGKPVSFRMRMPVTFPEKL